MIIRKKKTLLLLAAFLLVAFVLIKSRNRSREPDRSTHTQTAQPVSETLTMMPTSAVQNETQGALPLASNPTARTESVKVIPPRNEDLREEVKADPHVTPPSLVKFAANVGERMKLALQSETEAASFFNELEDCLSESGDSVSPSAQALCLNEARRLSLRFTSLAKRFEKVSGAAEPEVTRLSRFIGMGE